MSGLGTGTAAVDSNVNQTPSPAAPAAQAAEAIPAGATVVSEREAIPDANASPESYTDQGKLTADKWKEKTAKFHQKNGSKPAKVAKSASTTAATEPGEAKAFQVEEKPPVEATSEVDAEAGAASGEEETEGAAAAPKAFTPNPKFTAVGKEYTLPDYLAKAITSPEQEKELKDVYSKAMGLDHVKQRFQEVSDKYVGLETQHQEVTEGIQELAEIYAEAVQTQNPLILNDFFQKLQIPPQVILQYAQALSNYMDQDPASQQQVAAQLEAHRRARVLSQQNQQFSQSNFQSSVQARTMEMNTALARPEIAPTVQQFNAQFGPQAFEQELIRNGVYVHKTTGRDISIAENVAQVMQRFRLQGGQAPGQAPQVSQAQAQQQPQGQLPQNPASAPQANGKPVVPAQPHNKVPVIPGVNGKSTSPTKQQFRSAEDIKKYRQQKYGN